MKTYKQLLEERSTLNSAKQQIFHLNPKADLSEINKQICNLSKQIRSLEFNNIQHETICDDMHQSREPEMMSFDEFKAKNKHQIMKTITSKLVDINEIPIGVYAHCICAVKTGIDYIMKHNYNVYCDILKDKTDEK